MFTTCPAAKPECNTTDYANSGKPAMFFIIANDGTIVGNKKGYKTVYKAISVADNPRMSVFKKLYEIYDNRMDKNDNLIYSVK